MMRFCSFTGESKESLSRILLKEIVGICWQTFDKSIERLGCLFAG
jgi:hypothetical protein